jgi:succinate-acetate transporter protein
MNRLKLLRFLFALSVLLTVFFGILLIVKDTTDGVLGRIGLWCGFISQLLLAVVMYSEIRKAKKGQNN